MKKLNKIINAVVNFAIRAIGFTLFAEFLTIVSSIDALAEGQTGIGPVLMLGLLVCAGMFVIAMVLPFAVALAMELVKFFAKLRASHLLPKYRRFPLSVAAVAEYIGDYAASAFACVFKFMCF